jgi:hypothetical protein
VAKKTAAKKSVTKKAAVVKQVAKPSVEPTVTAALPRISPLVVLFVVYHVIAITIYALPKPSDQVLDGKIQPKGPDNLLIFSHKELKQWAVFYGYLYPSGCWQYWDMFAPNPAQTDYWCDAEVIFLDGTKTTFQYPRMKTLSISDKFMQERYRKFYERVNMMATDPYFAPSFAQAIAFKTATDPTSPPVRVTIVRHLQNVMRHDNPQPAEPPYQQERIFSYVVDQHKLFTDKGWKLGLH